MEGDFGEPELITIFPGSARIHPVPDGRLRSPTTDLSQVHNILEEYGASISVIFGPDEENMALSRSQEAQERPWEFATFCHVKGSPSEKLQEIASKLAALDVVDGAYVKPPVQPAVREMPPPQTANPLQTPDFTSHQGYLDEPPGGIEWSWFEKCQLKAEDYDLIVADCEWGWRVTHEDLQSLGIKTFTGNNEGGASGGTAVAGVIDGDQNPIGITGICLHVKFWGYCWANGRDTTSAIIQQAADHLRPGDILVLEGHSRGPRWSEDTGQFGLIPMEWWPDDFAAIANATKKGIIVVEAAGNGSQDLNDPIYEVPLAGFSSWWQNPFNPNGPDSTAILVGAGAPPPGTHGTYYGPDRSRLEYSNFGSRVNAQGWGDEDTTTGYGDLQEGNNLDLFYTDGFSKTSSATPIVTGALACVQVIVKKYVGTSITPSAARLSLMGTGSPQQDGSSGPKSQQIGNRPIIADMCQYLVLNGLIKIDHLPRELLESLTQCG